MQFFYCSLKCTVWLGTIARSVLYIGCSFLVTQKTACCALLSKLTQKRLRLVWIEFNFPQLLFDFPQAMMLRELLGNFSGTLVVLRTVLKQRYRPRSVHLPEAVCVRFSPHTVNLRHRKHHDGSTTKPHGPWKRTNNEQNTMMMSKQPSRIVYRLSTASPNRRQLRRMVATCAYAIINIARRTAAVSLTPLRCASPWFFLKVSRTRP